MKRRLINMIIIVLMIMVSCAAADLSVVYGESGNTKEMYVLSRTTYSVKSRSVHDESRYIYDADGLLTDIQETMENEDGMWITKCTYDKNSKLSSIKYSRQYGSEEETLLHKRTFSYRKNGSLKKEILKEFDGGTTTKTTFIYDKHGYLTKCSYVGRDFRQSSTIKNTLDKKGNLIKAVETVKMSDKSGTSKTAIVRTYDHTYKKGRIVKTVCTTKSEAAGTQTSTYTYTYNSRGQLTKEVNTWKKYDGKTVKEITAYKYKKIGVNKKYRHLYGKSHNVWKLIDLY